MSLENLGISNLVAGFLFGVIGLYFVRLGKREANVVAVGAGAVMLVYPYFTDNPWLTWGIGIGLTFLAYRSLRSA